MTTEPEKDLISAVSGTRWSKSGPAYWAGAETVSKVEPGIYNVALQDGVGPVLIKTDVTTDALIEFPNSISKQVMDEIRQFWTLRPKFEERHLTYKRGILLYGPTGSGKTSIVHLVGSALVKEHDGICILSYNPFVTSKVLQMIRRIEPKRPIALIMEDFDAQIDHNDESAFLALLDGELQIDNIISIATTNYMEKIAPRFYNRPSRFDIVLKVPLPDERDRRIYLNSIEPSFTEEELVEILKGTDGLSLAHMRELVILVKCFGKSIKEAVSRLKDMSVKHSSGEDFEETAGFIKRN